MGLGFQMYLYFYLHPPLTRHVVARVRIGNFTIKPYLRPYGRSYYSVIYSNRN